MPDNNVIMMTRDVALPPALGAEVTLIDHSTVREALEAFGNLLANSWRRTTDGTAADPNAAGQLLTRDRSQGRLSRLTPRELDVLALMAEGLGNAAIAARLFITEGGVHKHIRNIFAKLDLSLDNRVDRRVAAVLRYLACTSEKATHPAPSPRSHEHNKQVQS
jgi:DNA-binding NarL/FixJ family response regulator